MKTASRRFFSNTFAPAYLSRRVSIAPMMEWTDRHCRYFLRLISHHALLYTEMVTTGALIHGDRERFLAYHPTEHPLAVQLGGSNPEELAFCARLAEDHGFDEVNLNVGCPSDRVQSGRFGACLMMEPELVAECVAAMAQTVQLPVTVKTRIGVDEQDSYEALTRFINTVSQAGCRTFILHARKAWLQGLSPKENREKPPLRYEVVRAIKQDFPHLEVVINGGIATLEEAQEQLTLLDGIMIGRAAYHNPYLLAQVDRYFYGDFHPLPTRHGIMEAFLPYVEEQLAQGIYLSRITRHILGLFQGQPGARAWRRYLSENAHRPGAGIEVIREALRRVPQGFG
ncbi:TIM-barrel protein, yjbN family [Nitrosococcus halophilus Nc 4]|uniref:tRNA-dihydrouridine(20/20a) synthase n=1 Tax=Nitrosococcus halophilus (strain Nc4) TaxID=472759 RepID=D5BVC5_NITHN|nr:tRNA dihydrouridine(20/20a) synthase DusA [Nitrosococcus halophilus]ADE13553.1 TIM-barrel protein, yjbN family [Nitrosococcus halophilus Nc 4]